MKIVNVGVILELPVYFGGEVKLTTNSKEGLEKELRSGQRVGAFHCLSGFVPGDVKFTPRVERLMSLLAEDEELRKTTEELLTSMFRAGARLYYTKEAKQSY